MKFESSEPVSVSKKEAATAQLETAIKLYFENRDLISAYTLMGAADGILEGIWTKEQNRIQARRFQNGQPAGFSFSEEWSMRIKDEYQKLGWSLLHATRNFFKHADTDHDQEHLFHSVVAIGMRLLWTIKNYALIYDEITPAMNAYCNWYLAFHPELMKEDNRETASELLEQLVSFAERNCHIDHDEQAALGLQLLRQFSPSLFK